MLNYQKVIYHWHLIWVLRGAQTSLINLYKRHKTFLNASFRGTTWVIYPLLNWHSYGKSPFFMGKLNMLCQSYPNRPVFMGKSSFFTIFHGQLMWYFSMAMWDMTRVGSRISSRWTQPWRARWFPQCGHRRPRRRWRWKISSHFCGWFTTRNSISGWWFGTFLIHFPMFFYFF